MAKHFIVTSIKQTDRLASVIFSSSPKNLEFDVNFLKLRKSEFDWNYESKKCYSLARHTHMYTHIYPGTHTHPHILQIYEKALFCPPTLFHDFRANFFKKLTRNFFSTWQQKRIFWKKENILYFAENIFSFLFSLKKIKKAAKSWFFVIFEVVPTL